MGRTSKTITLITGDKVEGVAHWDELLPQVCTDKAGVLNKEALEVVIQLLRFSSYIDDLVDGEVELYPEAFTTQIMALMIVLSTNRFWLANAFQLLPIIQQGFSSWLDANQMEASPHPALKAAADPMKTYYFEFVWVVARIIGGWDQMRSLQRKYRGFDFDFPWEKYQSVAETAPAEAK